MTDLQHFGDLLHRHPLAVSGPDRLISLEPQRLTGLVELLFAARMSLGER